MSYLDNPFRFCKVIFCMNLKEKKNRWMLVQKEFNKLRISPVRAESIKMPKGQGRMGCLMTHQMIIEIARDKNLDNVLIFEDDVVFTDDALEVLKKALISLPEDYDVLYLGCRGGTIKPYCKPALRKVVTCKLNHATIFSKRVYDLIINAKDVNSMDKCSLKYILPRGNSYVVDPMIAFQRDKI